VFSRRRRRGRGPGRISLRGCRCWAGRGFRRRVGLGRRATGRRCWTNRWKWRLDRRSSQVRGKVHCPTWEGSGIQGRRSSEDTRNDKRPSGRASLLANSALFRLSARRQPGVPACAAAGLPLSAPSICCAMASKLVGFCTRAPLMNMVGVPFTATLSPSFTSESTSAE
jgi:hypothetical protein